MVTTVGDMGAFHNYGEFIAKSTTVSTIYVPFHNEDSGRVLLEAGTWEKATELAVWAVENSAVLSRVNPTRS